MCIGGTYIIPISIKVMLNQEDRQIIVLFDSSEFPGAGVLNRHINFDIFAHQ